MNNAKLRQRLLGAMVLLSIGFILFSVFLQTEPTPYIDRSARIPLQSEFIEPIEFAPVPDFDPSDSARQPSKNNDSDIENTVSIDVDPTSKAAVENESTPPIENLADRFASDEPIALEEVKAAPILNEIGEPNSWTIQVGSFSKAERAKEIRDQLIDKTYRAYYTRLQTEKGSADLYRVLVGPYLDAEQIEEHQKEINALLDVEALLVQYKP